MDAVDGVGPGADGHRHPVGDGQGVGFVVDPVAQHHELVAAEAGHEVGGAQHRGEAVGHLHQQGVPAVVAVAVVDQLEPVEIEEGQPDQPRLVRRARPSAASRRSSSMRAVRQTGERIVRGPQRQLGFTLAPVGDVMADGDDPGDPTVRRRDPP